MGRVKLPITITLDPEVLRWIDEERGIAPRSAFVNRMLKKFKEGAGKRGEKRGRNPILEVAGIGEGEPLAERIDEILY